MIEICNLTKTFKYKKTTIHAVDQISLTIERGEVLGLVGESGCGKSTLAKLLLQLIPQTSGKIFFEGAELSLNKDKKARRNIQMIFQDPYSSLNPRLNVEQLIAEPSLIHNLPNRVDELLQMVGLSPEMKKRYPHEFSGGQRQRIGIARALALKPQFLICDEPISSLDLSIQAQIINLLIDLKQKLNLTILFIAHDLAIVRYISDRIAVMQEGKIVEIQSSDALFLDPKHPYTQSLINAIPQPQFLNQKLHSKETTCSENEQVLL